MTDLRAPNAVHCISGPDSTWSTLNVAEAMPGVATPLGWGLWQEVEHSPRSAFYAMGALEPEGLVLPVRAEERICNLYYGRLALRVDYMCEMADRIPGTNAQSLADDIFGYVPPALESRPTKRRWPHVAVKLPRTFIALPKQLHALRADTDAWWRAAVAGADTLDLAGARRLYAEGAERFRQTISASGVASTVAIQPIFAEVAKLAAAAGIDDAALMKGHGEHEEARMIADLWAVSRDTLSLDEFLLRHGYHGPDEGNPAGHVWREDPTPLHSIIAGYRALPDAQNPASRAAAAVAEREAAEAEVLRKLPRSKRGSAKLIFRLASRYLPLRAVPKNAYVQSIDAGRAGARRGGVLLAGQGVIDAPDDVFFLTKEEFLGSPPADAKAAIAERKKVHAAYQELEIPTIWTGQPEATPNDAPVAAEALEGIGVSAGIAEGIVRVIDDPANTDMDEGEVLVTHTTDPSWASVMFLSGALVVDIGGQFSHAAIVARELGVPCVLNTKVGTRVLRTGDRVRVDGSAGTVEVLERA